MASVLHRNEIATDASVRGVKVLHSKKRPASTIHRMSIEYSDAEYDPDRPRSLFLKLGRPTKDEPLDICRAEVVFYNEVGAVIGYPPLIRCYDAEFNEETGQSHILLEDLTDTHMQPKQNTAPSEKMSRSAVEALAKAHARWWNNHAILEVGSEISDVLGTTWRRFDEAWLLNFVENLDKDVAAFLKVARLTPKQNEAYGKMLKTAPLIWGRLTNPNGLTVTHGDLHWWNFLYPKDRERDSVRLFDWQLWHIDLGARDLAFLLALGGFAEPRPSLEETLLRVYHDALDVEGYSWKMLSEDYRWSAIRNLNMPVIFWKQGKHYSTWQDALRRAFDSFERLRCAELL